MLQRAVSEAQTSETRVSTMQQWISRVDSVLKEHLENDTTMEDLPHDFQVLDYFLLYIICILSPICTYWM